jgi:hypothetical protein
MKNFLLAMVSILFFAIPANTQTDAKLTSNIIQPHKHIEGSTVSYTGGIYTIPNGKWAKAAELQPGVAGGTLKIHLVGDAATSYYSMQLDSNSIRGVLFDKIIQSGTTVTLNKLIIFIMD